MKKALSLLLLYLPFHTLAQIKVIKKPTLIVDVGNNFWPLKLEKDIVDSDTAYLVEFRDASYTQLIDLKLIRFSKVELKEFAAALSQVLIASLKDQVVIPKAIISKEKGPFGIIYYQLYYDHALCNMKEKQVRKLIDASNRE